MGSRFGLRLVPLLGALIFGASAHAAGVCGVDLSGPLSISPTGACALAETQKGSDPALTSQDESATTATAISIQPLPIVPLTPVPPLPNPTPTPYYVDAVGTADYPDGTGVGGSAGARAFASSTDGTPLAATSGGLFIGVFTATGDSPGALIPMQFNLGLTGRLFTQYNPDEILPTTIASVTLQFSAFDNAGEMLGVPFTGSASLGNGTFISDGLTPDPLSGGFMPDSATGCGITGTCGYDIATSDMGSFDVKDGESFGLFLNLVALSFVNVSLLGPPPVEVGDPAPVEVVALSNFLNTAILEIHAPAGVDVTASPATVPLPASAGFLLAAVFGLGVSGYRKAALRARTT